MLRARKDSVSMLTDGELERVRDLLRGDSVPAALAPLVLELLEEVEARRVGAESRLGAAVRVLVEDELLERSPALRLCDGTKGRSLSVHVTEQLVVIDVRIEIGREISNGAHGA
jgi:hypothetical protein